MANLGTDRLNIVNDQPSVEQLWNGRFRLEFYLDNDGKKEDWFADNIGNILPPFGTLQASEFGLGHWEARDGEAYDNMICVKAETEYVPAAQATYVKLSYETISDIFVQEKDDDTDTELNGLRRVTRDLIGTVGLDYAEVVGTSTITSDGITLTLGSIAIDDTDAYRKVKEVWLESGELSRTDNFEDGKESITITNIGSCPSAPSGYTAVKQDENDTLGFPTCTVTFYKDDSILSRSNDYVGTQLAEVVEVFNPTVEPTPTQGGTLGSQSVSNVDGIPTTRYTFLVAGKLSQSEDKVGSQLAITIESFNEVPATPSGYLIAKTDTSDFEGIPTKRYTFLLPSILSQTIDLVGSQEAIVIETFSMFPTIPSGYEIAKTDVSNVEGISTNRYTFLKSSVLSVTQEFTESSTAIKVRAFNMTEAQVSSSLSEVTSSHVAVSQDESDYEGIKTNTFTFELEEYDVINFERNGLMGVQRVSILASGAFYSGQVGVTTIVKQVNNETPVLLYLANFKIDDTTSYRKVEEVWAEAGKLSESDPLVGANRIRVQTVVWQMVEGSNPSGYVASATKTENIGGFKTITVSYYQSDDLSTEFTYQTTVPFTIPGTVNWRGSDLGGGATNRSLDVAPPIATTCLANITENYTTDTEDVEIATLYQPDFWTKVIIEGLGLNFRPFTTTSHYVNHIALDDGTNLTGLLLGGINCIQGNRIYGGTTAYIRIDGPSFDPAGAIGLIINIDIQPVFRLLDGTQYYRKVTTAIDVPARGTA
jgi:hypothetical protein